MLLYKAYAVLCPVTHCSTSDKNYFVPCVSSLQALNVQMLFIYFCLVLSPMLCKKNVSAQWTKKKCEAVILIYCLEDNT